MGIQSFPIAQINPPTTTPVKGTSLAEMMSMAQNAQALQQAQQLNPLQLQKAQLELQQAQSINPLALRKVAAETELAEKTLTPSIQAKEAEAKRLQLVADQTGVDVTNHYANIARGVYGGLLTDPDFVSGNSKKMQEKLNKAKNFIEDLGIPMHQSKMHDTLIEAVKQNPKEAYQLIKNGIQQAGTSAEQFAQVNKPADYINTGQMQVPIYQSPYQGGGPGNTPAVQNVLPPTTPTVSPAGQPGYLGAQNNQGFTPSALPPGVETQMKAPAESYAEYVKAIPKKQYSANMVNISSEELKEALSKFKPGAGTSTMVGLSQKLQAIGAPQSLVDKIAGGDLSAAQETQKFLARSVMDNLKVAAQGDPTRVAEIDNFVKNFPQFDTDPRAINKFIEFSQKQANRDLQEINFYNKKQEKGEINPNTYFGELQNYMQNQGFVPKIGEAKATIAESKKETQVGHGKVVKTGSYNGKPVVQYEDGFVEYK